MKIPIIATSQTRFGELWDKGIRDLIREAGINALDNSKLKPDEIGELYISNVFSSKAGGQALLSSMVYEELGISNGICVNAGDASGALAIKEAANSILAGESKMAMVLGVEKVSDLKTNELALLSSELLSEEEASAGASIFSQFAIMTRRYLHDFRLSPEDLSFIPSASHKNALDNLNAQYRFELSEEKINSSPMLSDPVRVFDCASYCDGAAALIMCSEETARKLNADVKGYLLAGCSSSDSLSLSERKSITAMHSTINAAANSFRIAGVSCEKIDLMELHDVTPISEVIAVEDLGFAKKGEGIKFAKKNSKKINLSGGLKACGHAIGATGVRQAVDVINRLNANKLYFGLTHTLAGTGAVSAVNIFGSR
ncbi:hypothetical protein HYY70_01810 [Candidatus Woesearchaeota archaeon]|nr:hypothetical protein [Candidatus Woesearchaeota archaeon]